MSCSIHIIYITFLWICNTKNFAAVYMIAYMKMFNTHTLLTSTSASTEFNQSTQKHSNARTSCAAEYRLNTICNQSQHHHQKTKSNTHNPPQHELILLNMHNSQNKQAHACQQVMFTHRLLISSNAADIFSWPKTRWIAT